eukprot:9335888-Pyramimonas_sp.AAC.1
MESQSSQQIVEKPVIDNADLRAYVTQAPDGGGTSKILHVECNFGYVVAWRGSSGQRIVCALYSGQPRRLFVVDRTTA